MAESRQVAMVEQELEESRIGWPVALADAPKSR
jgi:hypothetical protein